MPETRKLIIEQGKSTDFLWQLIDKGWSVVSAVYLFNKKQFIIKLSEAAWPEVTLACSSCGVELAPRYLAFRPWDMYQRLCIACDR